MDIDKTFDKKQIYCRKLGHHLTFIYCRNEHEMLPCGKIRDCWFEKMPIDSFLQKHYLPDQIRYVFKPSKQKIATLIDLIENAKKYSE